MAPLPKVDETPVPAASGPATPEASTGYVTVVGRPTLAGFARRPLVGFGIDLLLGVTAMLALTVLALTASTMFGWAPAANPPATPGETLVPAVLLATTVITGGVAVLLYWYRRRASPAELALSLAAASRASTWAWAGFTGVATWLASGAILAAADRAGAMPQPTNAVLLDAGMAAQPVLLVALVVVLAPAYEELLFRRVLFGRLWAAGRPLLGLVLSSMVFALMHEFPGSGGNSMQATTWLWLLYSAMGAAYAVLYRHTGTLWAPILAHAINNALAMGALNLYGTS